MTLHASLSPTCFPRPISLHFGLAISESKPPQSRNCTAQLACAGGKGLPHMQKRFPSFVFTQGCRCMQASHPICFPRPIPLHFGLVISESRPPQSHNTAQLARASGKGLPRMQKRFPSFVFTKGCCGMQASHPTCSHRPKPHQL